MTSQNSSLHNTAINEFSGAINTFLNTCKNSQQLDKAKLIDIISSFEKKGYSKPIQMAIVTTFIMNYITEHPLYLKQNSLKERKNFRGVKEGLKTMQKRQVIPKTTGVLPTDVYLFVLYRYNPALTVIKVRDAIIGKTHNLSTLQALLKALFKRLRSTAGGTAHLKRMANAIFDQSSPLEQCKMCEDLIGEVVYNVYPYEQTIAKELNITTIKSYEDINKICNNKTLYLVKGHKDNRLTLQLIHNLADKMHYLIQTDKQSYATDLIQIGNESMEHLPYDTRLSIISDKLPTTCVVTILKKFEPKYTKPFDLAEFAAEHIKPNENETLYIHSDAYGLRSTFRFELPKPKKSDFSSASENSNNIVPLLGDADTFN